MTAGTEIMDDGKRTKKDLIEELGCSPWTHC